MEQPKPRRSRAELRELVLEAGREILVDMSPTLGFERLSYSRVFKHLEATADIRVTHASVHERIWPSQEAFQYEVLRSALDGVTNDSVSTYLPQLQATIASADLGSVEGRKAAFNELIRVGQNANWEGVVLADRSRLRAYQMLYFSMSTTDVDSFCGPRRDLWELMVELRAKALAGYRETIVNLCKFVGLQPRAELGDHAEVMDRVIESLNLTAIGFLVDPHRQPDEMWSMPTGENGELRDWRPVSFAVWNHLRGMFELSGDGLDAAERQL